MAEAAFDYGATPADSGGKSFKNPEEGKHTARLRSIIHLGMNQEEFQGKTKTPAPMCVAIFELKDEGDVDDDGNPLEIHKPFSLRKGDKAFATKLIKALDPKGKASGFDALIGAVCEVEIKGSKEKDDDGKPKYANFGGVSELHPKLAAMTEPLAVEGAGHCRFENLTKEAILELRPISEVADLLMTGMNYAGSKAEKIVAEIRKENPEFAKRKQKDNEDPPERNGDAPPPSEPPPPPKNMKEDEEF